MSQTLVFRYDLNPTLIQSDSIASHIGAVRFAYNWSIGYVTDNWTAVHSGHLSEYVGTSAYSLRKALNAAKTDIAPWWNENSKEAFATGTANAAKAFDNWRASRSGKINGHAFGFPRFKKKSLTLEGSIRFTTGAMRVTKYAVTIPRIGSIKLLERPKATLWLMSQGAKISQISVGRNGNHWAAAISIKMDDALANQYFTGRTRKASRKAVGVDVGIKDAFVTSDGLIVENPKHYVKLQKKLRRQQKRLSRRQGPDYKNGVAPSRRWENSRDDVRNTHTKIASIRKDFIHKATRSLIDEYETVVIEDLNVAGMVKNRHLSKHILDASFGEFRRQMEYKARWYGRKLVVADRFFPSSKTCSDCGTVKAKLPLSERTYVCAACGMSINRDLNAARNLVALSYRETQNGRGDGSSGPALVLGETAVTEASSESRRFSQAKQGT